MLAERFKKIASDDSQAARLAWHHLVLAVGNFKRQAPIHLERLPGTLSDDPSEHSPTVWIPEDGGFTLHADDERLPERTWDRLLCGRGIETATATAILAALWPQRHVIFDVWVANVANAIHADDDGSYPGRPAALPYSMDGYRMALPMFRELAERYRVPLLFIERASFVLAKKLGNDQNRTWQDYIDALNDELGR